ncbi:MAG: DUF4832 domain-containing protein [Acidobacteriaceae bacterium]|nr:DUF4832 domain-containing protein [Acidobacteriaceae bacterium]
MHRTILETKISSSRVKGLATTAAVLLSAGLSVTFAQSQNVVVRPAEIHDVLINPGMGIQTFQRFNGDALNTGTRWSEVGPETPLNPTGIKPDFPDASVAYLRWFWSQLQPAAGEYRWSIIDLALEQARAHHQKLMIRMMPYDQAHALPEWYRQSGARRINKPTDKDGKIWQPDADDPLYTKYWGEMVAAAGARYDGHPFLDSVDISTVGYWGEGWGPYLPSWPIQRQLIDQYFDAFHRTPLLMNFDALEALRYGTQRGAGWRLDCWGDLGRPGKRFSEMLDFYPQQVVKAGVQDVWQRSPVSLETCGTPAGWKEEDHYTAAQVEYDIAQAVRWHASTINIKSTAIPAEWENQFDEFRKKLGYRFMLRRLEYPEVARRGTMMPVNMWWLNAGIAPVYADYILAIQLRGPDGASAVIRTPAEVRKWLPGDAVFDDTVAVPYTLPAGEYRFRIALLDARTLEPAIRLAIGGRQDDGWYDLGSVRLE